VRNYLPLPFLKFNKLCTLIIGTRGRRVLEGFLLFTAGGFRSCNGERFRV